MGRLAGEEALVLDVPDAWPTCRVLLTSNLDDFCITLAALNNCAFSDDGGEEVDVAVCGGLLLEVEEGIAVPGCCRGEAGLSLKLDRMRSTLLCLGGVLLLI